VQPLNQLLKRLIQTLQPLNRYLQNLIQILEVVHQGIRGLPRIPSARDDAPRPASGMEDGALADQPSLWHQVRGATGRFRRQMRKRILEPVLVGHRSFRETVLNAVSARGHLIYCDTPHGRFFVDPADRTVGTHLVWRGVWQHAELDQAISILVQESRLQPGTLFVDAGANIGVQTVYALRSGRFGSAVSFEPEPGNRRLLEMNVAANGLANQVRVVGKALGDTEGHATLYLHPRNKGAHAVGRRPSYDGTESIEVEIVRLSTELDAYAVSDIGMIWIDVEGLEPDVVRSLGKYLGQVPLVIEYAPARYSKATRQAFDELLAAKYSILHRLGAEASPAESPRILPSIEGIVDILVY
jgi:FkbM family methyltransferase